MDLSDIQELLTSPEDVEELKKEVDRALYKSSFVKFLYNSWEHIDPSKITANWHLDAIANHLQAAYEGKITKLIINIPPGHAKSSVVSVLFPAWVWTHNPSWQVITASYAAELTLRDADKMRDLVRSEWYQNLFCIPDGWSIAKDQDNKGYFKTTAKGHRQSVSVNSKATGLRGNALVVDDPLSVMQAQSALHRATANNWFLSTMSTRFNDPKKPTQIVVMQRLHDQDLTGVLVAKKLGFQVLSLPSEFDPNRRTITYTDDGKEFWRDPRQNRGELLFPQVFDTDALAGLKKSLGPYDYAAQHDQSPVPLTGGIIKREWFKKRWAIPGENISGNPDVVEIPQKMESFGIYVDANFKAVDKSKTGDTDFVAAIVAAKKGPNVYILDVFWDQVGFNDTLKGLEGLLQKWPQYGSIKIEPAANGDAIIDMLKQNWSGVIELEQGGGKHARISAAIPKLAAENVIFPADAWWIDAALTECCTYPKASHDDFPDALSYAIIDMLGGGENIDQYLKAYS